MVRFDQMKIMFHASKREINSGIAAISNLQLVPRDVILDQLLLQ